MDFNATLIGESIAMIVFVWFCMKYIWPPLMQVIEERQKKIADGLDAASRAERDLELAQSKATDNLREAKEQAAGIIDQANRRASQIVEEAKDQARSEGERIKAAAQSEIEQEVVRAKEGLRKQVSVLAVAGAEKILQKSVDATAHSEMLNKLAADL